MSVFLKYSYVWSKFIDKSKERGARPKGPLEWEKRYVNKIHIWKYQVSYIWRASRSFDFLATASASASYLSANTEIRNPKPHTLTEVHQLITDLGLAKLKMTILAAASGKFAQANLWFKYEVFGRHTNCPTYRRWLNPWQIKRKGPTEEEESDQIFHCVRKPRERSSQIVTGHTASWAIVDGVLFQRKIGCCSLLL